MSRHRKARNAERAIRAARVVEREVAFRAESTAIVAVGLGFGYLAAATALGATLHAWHGWRAVVVVLVLFAIVGALIITRRAVRAVRTRDAARV